MKPSRGPLALCHCLPLRNIPPRHKTLPWAFSFLPLPSRSARTHVALQRQPFASAWPCRHIHLEGFKTAAKHGPPGHETLPWAFSALPLPSQRLAMSPYSPFRRFQNSCETRSTRHKTFRGPLALCHCLPMAWPCRHNPFKVFQNRCETRLPWALGASPLPAQRLAMSL